MKRYALIRDGKIAKFRNIKDDDNIIIPKLLVHDYLIVEEDPLPEFDSETQRIVDSYNVETTRVVRTWTVIDKTAEEIEAEQNRGAI